MWTVVLVISVALAFYGVADARVECKDWLDEMYYIEVFGPGGGNVTNCKTLVRKYLYLCNKEYGKRGGKCCKSCSKQDLRCIDQTNIVWTVNDVSMKCRVYVRDKPGRCNFKMTKRVCCASCKKYEDQCKNNKSYIANLLVKMGKKEVKCYNCKCGDVKAKGKRFVRRACKISGRLKEECCVLCRD